MLDFSNTVDVGLLIDDASAALREATIGHGGILCAKELAFTFVTPRANDLKWRYVVDSYHKGTTPEAFDLLYWDSDSVSLAGPRRLIPAPLSRTKGSAWLKGVSRAEVIYYTSGPKSPETAKSLLGGKLQTDAQNLGAQSSICSNRSWDARIRSASLPQARPAYPHPSSC